MNHTLNSLLFVCPKRETSGGRDSGLPEQSLRGEHIDAIRCNHSHEDHDQRLSCFCAELLHTGCQGEGSLVGMYLLKRIVKAAIVIHTLQFNFVGYFCSNTMREVVYVLVCM